MNEQKEIETKADIKVLVDGFYEKVRLDNLLGGVFNGIVGDRWPQHLEKMYRFWQTILLKELTYSGSPFPPHAQLPVDVEHFDRWKELFNQTVNEYFIGEKAEEAMWRAEKMATIFQSKIAYYRNSGTKSLI